MSVVNRPLFERLARQSRGEFVTASRLIRTLCDKGKKFSSTSAEKISKEE
jgi:hypothetical protein